MGKSCNQRFSIGKVLNQTQGPSGGKFPLDLLRVSGNRQLAMTDETHSDLQHLGQDTMFT